MTKSPNPYAKFILGRRWACLRTSPSILGGITIDRKYTGVTLTHNHLTHNGKEPCPAEECEVKLDGICRYPTDVPLLVAQSPGEQTTQGRGFKSHRMKPHGQTGGMCESKSEHVCQGE